MLCSLSESWVRLCVEGTQNKNKQSSPKKCARSKCAQGGARQQLRRLKYMLVTVGQCLASAVGRLLLLHGCVFRAHVDVGD